MWKLFWICVLRQSRDVTLHIHLRLRVAKNSTILQPRNSKPNLNWLQLRKCGPQAATKQQFSVRPLPGEISTLPTKNSQSQKIDAIRKWVVLPLNLRRESPALVGRTIIHERNRRFTIRSRIRATWTWDLVDVLRGYRIFQEAKYIDLPRYTRTFFHLPILPPTTSCLAVPSRRNCPQHHQPFQDSHKFHCYGISPLNAHRR